MRTNRWAWSVAGLVAGIAGLATSFFVAMAMTIRSSPVVAIAELVIRQTPGRLAERAIQVLGHHDKPFLVTVILIGSCALFAYAGRLAARSWWAPVVVFGVMAVIGGLAVGHEHGTDALDLLPVVVGFVTWVLCLCAADRAAAAGGPRHRGERRTGGGRAAAASCSAAAPWRRSPRRSSCSVAWSAGVAGTWRRPGDCSGCPGSPGRRCRRGRSCTSRG